MHRKNLQCRLLRLSLPLSFITFGLFSFVVNAVLFWVAASVSRLGIGFWAAFLGSMYLATVSSLMGIVARRVGR